MPWSLLTSARQRLVEPDRPVVKLPAFGGQVVRADDGGVATGATPPNVSLVEHRHPVDPVVLGQVIGRGQPVNSGADDHHVVASFEVMTAPDRWPGFAG